MTVALAPFRLPRLSSLLRRPAARTLLPAAPGADDAESTRATMDVLLCCDYPCCQGEVELLGLMACPLRSC